MIPSEMIYPITVLIILFIPFVFFATLNQMLDLWDRYLLIKYFTEVDDDDFEE